MPIPIPADSDSSASAGADEAGLGLVGTGAGLGAAALGFGGIVFEVGAALGGLIGEGLVAALGASPSAGLPVVGKVWPVPPTLGAKGERVTLKLGLPAGGFGAAAGGVGSPAGGVGVSLLVSSLMRNG